ncbi:MULTISPECIES: AAA family ATPase [Bacillus]|uniref:ATP-binding protein n=1 Tax=Bacillus pseudomycoides TaxID=64104 RepID=A0AAJ3R7F9_9BACI|nr:AAA family ATPase [Bacillus pseudomycoides]KFN12495.1 thymidylate kinase family protein [Bacillus pseudomycoides]MBD5800384.1 ATP-binding protein [Bacillus pseudomycoides]MCR8856756.1 ATP-binding protein [Bacillus pseudomycoides]MDR4187084.1 ATP-binding protein [Bacillus pseudomycoides]MDR4325741.1 ATP-binding protein [Bacillus pseudomycoides]
MTYIISLQGPMASGKTTLARRLEKHGFPILYENPYGIVEKRKNLNLDIYTKEGFITNQRMFIEAKIKEIQNARGRIVIFDRGSEDIEFYTIYFPKLIGMDWDIENELKDELYKLRRCHSDAIFYLDVSKKILQERKKNDNTRRRSTFEKQLELAEIEKQWYKQFPVTYVNTDEATVEETERYFMKWVKEKSI